ncbi:hypothetical protein Dimus_005612, partial [Dionaea muscipula]
MAYGGLTLGRTEENSPAKNVDMNKVNEEAANEEEQAEFEWEVMNEEATVEGEQTEKVTEVEDTRSGEKFYDVVDEERIADVDMTTPEVIVPAPAAQI